MPRCACGVDPRSHRGIVLWLRPAGALAIVAVMADRMKTIPAETRRRVAAAGGAKRAENLPDTERSAIARLGAEAANRPSRLAARIAKGWKGTPLAEKRRVAAELARLPRFAELITSAGLVGLDRWQVDPGAHR